MKNTTPQKILAIDTAMNGCGVGLYDATRDVCVSRVNPMPRGHAEVLVPLIEDMLAEAQLEFKALEAIVTTVGPGAFTGLRIGLSTARALGLALDIPVYGISNLQALALSYVPAPAAFTVLIETKRTDFYAQSFDAQGTPLNEAVAAPAQDILAAAKGGSFIGDALARFQDVSKDEDLSNFDFVKGYDLADPGLLAQMLTDKKSQTFLTDPAPIYLRGADVTMPKVNPRAVTH